jgi:hypothetical protein
VIAERYSVSETAKPAPTGTPAASATSTDGASARPASPAAPTTSAANVGSGRPNRAVSRPACVVAAALETDDLGRAHD